MKKRTKIFLASVGLGAAGAGAALWSGAARWNAETARMVEKLERAARASETKTVSFSDFDDLPAPAARYFRFALKDGQPVVRTARIRHAGEFNLNDKWIPFESEQHFSSHPPAFVWDAKMRTNPLIRVRVRDGYYGGQGSMTAKMFGLFTVVNADQRNEKLALGALLRFLAESAWQPTALLPTENLKWSAIDDNRALATLTDSGVTISLEFIFNESGEITGIFSPARFYEINGEYKPLPWAGRFWNYGRRGGMMIPLEGEVEWRLPEGPAPYWRGRIAEADYEFEE
jgi:hypothetical protein